MSSFFFIFRRFFGVFTDFWVNLKFYFEKRYLKKCYPFALKSFLGCFLIIHLCFGPFLKRLDHFSEKLWHIEKKSYLLKNVRKSLNRALKKAYNSIKSMFNIFNIQYSICSIYLICSMCFECVQYIQYIEYVHRVQFIKYVQNIQYIQYI